MVPHQNITYISDVEKYMFFIDFSIFPFFFLRHKYYIYLQMDMTTALIIQCLQNEHCVWSKCITNCICKQLNNTKIFLFDQLFLVTFFDKMHHIKASVTIRIEISTRMCSSLLLYTLLKVTFFPIWIVYFVSLILLLYNMFHDMYWTRSIIYTYVALI